MFFFYFLPDILLKMHSIVNRFFCKSIEIYRAAAKHASRVLPIISVFKFLFKCFVICISFPFAF